jgi:hypothetical protein
MKRKERISNEETIDNSDAYSGAGDGDGDSSGSGTGV